MLTMIAMVIATIQLADTKSSHNWPGRKCPGIFLETAMQKPFQLTEAMEKEMSELVKDEVRPTFTKRTSRSLINERQHTHGDFRSNARISQMLKAVFRSVEHWQHLDDTEKEAMDMIALKMSRVLCGKSLERQHWEDIGGYAELVVRECGDSLNQ